MNDADKALFVSDCSLRRIITCGVRARVSEVLHYFSYCGWLIYLAVRNSNTRRILVLYRTNIITYGKTLSTVKKKLEETTIGRFALLWITYFSNFFFAVLDSLLRGRLKRKPPPLVNREFHLYPQLRTDKFSQKSVTCKNAKFKGTVSR